MAESAAYRPEFANRIIVSIGKIDVQHKSDIGGTAMQDKVIKQNHNIILENRRSLSISGITDVDSFDEKEISLYTQMGELSIKGRELHIDAMSVETGDMTITGDIWALIYGDKDKKSPVSALGKLFR